MTPPLLAQLSRHRRDAVMAAIRDQARRDIQLGATMTHWQLIQRYVELFEAGRWTPRPASLDGLQDG
jgi:hypothetical protein